MISGSVIYGYQISSVRHMPCDSCDSVGRKSILDGYRCPPSRSLGLPRPKKPIDFNEHRVLGTAHGCQKTPSSSSRMALSKNKTLQIPTRAKSRSSKHHTPIHHRCPVGPVGCKTNMTFGFSEGPKMGGQSGRLRQTIFLF